MEQLRPNSCLYGLSQSPESSGAARRNWESWEMISLMVWHPNIQKMRAESQSPWERKRGLGGNGSEHTQAILASCPLLWSCQNLSRVSRVLILSLPPTVTLILTEEGEGREGSWRASSRYSQVHSKEVKSDTICTSIWRSGLSWGKR